MDNNSRIFDFLYHALEHFPKPDMFAGKEAGIWKKFSTREIAETVNKLSAGLLELGLSGNNMEVEQQDKVAIISRNRPEWLMLDLACQQIGVALCPIYPTTNIHEIEFIFNESEIKHVFISGEEILEKINKVKPHVPSLKNVYSFDALAQVEHWQVLLKDSLSGTKEKLENWKKKISATHCATIIYTSGTTGTPKGVMLSHRNLVSNVLNSKNHSHSKIKSTVGH